MIYRVGGGEKGYHFSGDGGDWSPERFTWSLSLLTGGLIQNGPELSRARRCWVRRSEPLTARTVLGSSKKGERLLLRLSKVAPQKWLPPDRL